MTKKSIKLSKYIETENLELNNWGKADLHIHTDFSYDGLSSVKEILDFAEKNTDLSIIAITDHNKIDMAYEAKKMSDNHYEKIKVIIGEEINTKHGEIIGLFLKTRVKPRRNILDTIREVKLQGGLVILPHPFHFLGKVPGVKGGVSKRTLNRINNEPKIEADAIEFLNPTIPGKLGHNQVKKLQNELDNLAIIGSSDAHSYEYIGKSYTLFPGKTPEDLRKAIINRSTLAAGNFMPVFDTVKLFNRNFNKYLKKILFAFNSNKSLKSNKTLSYKKINRE